MDSRQLAVCRLQESISVKESILADDDLLEALCAAAADITRALRNRGVLYLCGNGGSASDAQHIAGELVGRFQMERHGLPAVALSCDGAVMSSIMNDYGAEFVFERQVEACVKENDVLIGISTSGNSENVRRAMARARNLGAVTVGLLGNGGGRIRELCDRELIVPSSVTARIQEAHIAMGHILCEIVERELFA